MPKINFELGVCIGKGDNPCSQTFNTGNIVDLNQKFWFLVSPFWHFMLISSEYDKLLNWKEIGKLITLPCYFSIEKSLFKNIFGHKFCICQPIFKILLHIFQQI